MADEKHIRPEDLKLPDVEILATNFIVVLGNKAYDSLGLIPREGKQPEVNLKQAKMAVDIMSNLCDQIIPLVDEKQKQELKNILTTIRMAYVQKAGAYVPGK
jgi:hypothetical protein